MTMPMATDQYSEDSWEGDAGLLAENQLYHFDLQGQSLPGFDINTGVPGAEARPLDELLPSAGTQLNEVSPGTHDFGGDGFSAGMDPQEWANTQGANNALGANLLGGAQAASTQQPYGPGQDWSSALDRGVDWALNQWSGNQQGAAGGGFDQESTWEGIDGVNTHEDILRQQAEALAHGGQGLLNRATHGDIFWGYQKQLGGRGVGPVLYESMDDALFVAQQMAAMGAVPHGFRMETGLWDEMNMQGVESKGHDQMAAFNQWMEHNEQFV